MYDLEKMNVKGRAQAEKDPKDPEPEDLAGDVEDHIFN